MIIFDGLFYFFFFASIYFEVFLLLTFFENKNLIKKEENPRTLKYYPSSTIMVPCYNEESTIAWTINSLLNLNYPKDKLKIFIIDDGSTDNTFQQAQRFRNNSQVKIFRKQNGGKHTALNLGLEYADTELIGCLDADSFAAPEALKEMIKHFDNPETMAVTPALKIHNPKNIIELIQSMEYKLSIFIRKIFALLGAQFVTPGPFSIFRREVFNHVGHYRRAHQTEDLEMALRIQSHHYKIDNSHRAFVYTVAPKSLKGLYKQRVRWIQGFLKNAIDYRGLFFKKEYGNLGFFVLPLALISVFSAICFAGRLLFNSVAYASDKIAEYSVIGFNPGINLNFDWFAISIQTMTLLAAILLILTFAFVLIGKRMAEGRINITSDLFLYLFLYGLIAPLWLIKSVYNVIFSKKTNWK